MNKAINTSSSTNDYTANEIIVMVEQLPAEAVEDESMLAEITDSKILAHVNNLVPGLIPAGAKLVSSKDIAGAVAANVVASSVGVVSMVVGQYCMTQINAQLTEISAGISKIANFRDNEYKSKVFALTTQVKNSFISN